MPTTVTTTTSWFARLGNSLKNILFGLLFVIASVILLFWNEGRAVKTHQSLKEGASLVKHVSIEEKDQANEGLLVHFSGPARTASVLTDVDFGVGSNALKLRRIVEVYQWKEETQSTTVDKLGGSQETTTTYTYKKDWSSNLIDSSGFKEAQTHQNPTAKLYENNEWIAEVVSVGAYDLPQDLLSSLTGYQPFKLSQEMFTSLPTATQEKIELVGNDIYYQTSDTTTPQIGDTRIRYEIITPQTISVIAQQSGETLQPYITKNGRSISMIQLGEHTEKQMFEGAIASNAMLTWTLRIVGAILMFVGFTMLLSVLSVVGSVIPLIGSIVGFGTGIVSALLTLILASITIAIAWITYRPLVGIALLAVAVGGFFLLQKRTKK